MDKPNYDIEIIEKYCLGLMEGQELVDFEDQLGRDKELTEEVELFKMAHVSIKSYGLKQKLKGFHEELINDQEPKSINWNFMLRIAASLTILVIAGVWYYGQNDQTLFEQHFQPYENIINVRGSETDTFNKGMKFYTIGKYQKAISEFDKLDSQFEQKGAMLFYKGISLLALGRENEAIGILTSLSDSRFSEQAKWYLALAHLKNDNKTAATELLSNIAPGQFQYQRAQNILEDLNKQ